MNFEKQCEKEFKMKISVTSKYLRGGGISKKNNKRIKYHKEGLTVEM